jgi:mono/diheme cytochrome c family protein
MKTLVLRLSLASTVALLIAAWAAPSIAADMAAAKQNYQTFCVKCHGPEGKGDGPGAAALKTKPRNFNDCARMKSITDDTLFKVIKNGGAANGLSADMPSWSQGFEDDEIHGLVDYVRAFCKK